MTELQRRLQRRGSDDEATIEKRLQIAQRELEQAKTEGFHDKILVNDDLVCPTDFSDILGITPAAISFHLAKMKQLGIVQTVRNGQNVCYSLAKTREGRRLILLIKELSAKA